MSTPVFVIHGVANRDRQAFESTVAALGRRTIDLELIPVFWGDLGARDTYLEAVIPRSDNAEDTQVRTRSGGSAGESATELELTKDLLGGPPLISAVSTDSAVTVRGSAAPLLDGPLIVAEAAAQRGTQSGGEAVRGSEPEWRTMLREVWPELTYLPQVQEPAILRDIGVALAEPDGAAPSVQEVRGAKSWLKQRVHDMDRAVGAVVGAVAGRVNTYARTELGPNIARFAGDIAVYQRNQDKIQGRVREALRAYDVEAGLAELPAGQRTGGAGNPARFICHSLGGVVTLDLATRASEPVHLGGLVTFGSQWPLFQLFDPREGIAVYAGDPVALPASVGRWVNLWEPMDPLAFVAGHAFRLADGSAPDDRVAAHLGSSGLWTHSSYWSLPELTKAARDVFGS